MMASVQKAKLTSEMQYIQDALKAGRATRQKFSMKQLRRLDQSLQPRVIHLDMDHVKTLGDILKTNRDVDPEFDLHPGVLFRDAKENWLGLVDGWHRHEAYRRAKSDYFPAYVIEGTREDAIEYAAMANQHAMLKRTNDDVKKQVYMLLGIPEWFKSTKTKIAKHVGISSSTVAKYMGQYCGEFSLDYPKEIVGENGFTRKVRAKGNSVQEYVDDKGHVRYRAKHNGKQYYLGSNRRSAEERLDGIVKEHASRRVEMTPKAIRRWVAGHGIRAIKASLDYAKYPGAAGLIAHGYLCVVADVEIPGELLRAIGKLVVLAQIAIEPFSNLVVICYHENRHNGIIDAAGTATINGMSMKFLTPEQLVVSIKGDR